MGAAGSVHHMPFTTVVTFTVFSFITLTLPAPVDAHKFLGVSVVAKQRPRIPRAQERVR